MNYIDSLGEEYESNDSTIQDIQTEILNNEEDCKRTIVCEMLRLMERNEDVVTLITNELNNRKTSL